MTICRSRARRSPEWAIKFLNAGGYLERKDERKSPRRAVKWTTRLYDVNGVDQGVANYPKNKLLRAFKIKEIQGPQGQQRWILK